MEWGRWWLAMILAFSIIMLGIGGGYVWNLRAQNEQITKQRDQLYTDYLNLKRKIACPDCGIRVHGSVINGVIVGDPGKDVYEFAPCAEVK